MKQIICYSVGGLGNRMRPLSSVYSISKKTGRELKLIWPSVLRCLAPYESVFQTPIPFSSLEELLSKNSVSLYILQDALNNEIRWGNELLQQLVNKFGYKPSSQSHEILNDPAEVVMILDNNFLAGSDRSDELHFLQNILSPTEEIMQKLHHEQLVLRLNNNTIGVHARGTDFKTPLSFYTDQMDKWISRGYNNFFVCSDSPEYEQMIKSKYGNMIRMRNGKTFVCKDNKSSEWRDNVHTSTESVKDSLVDLYLLSYTNFQIYNEHSTFAIIVNVLKEK